jgi:hypothetical protein
MRPMSSSATPARTRMTLHARLPRRFCPLMPWFVLQMVRYAWPVDPSCGRDVPG